MVFLFAGTAAVKRSLSLSPASSSNAALKKFQNNKSLDHSKVRFTVDWWSSIVGKIFRTFLSRRNTKMSEIDLVKNVLTFLRMGQFSDIFHSRNRIIYGIYQSDIFI